MKKEFLELLKADKEVQKLKIQYHEMFGHHRAYSIWEDGSIEGYKANMRRALEERKPY